MNRGGGEVNDLNLAKQFKEKKDEIIFVCRKPLSSRVEIPLLEFPTILVSSPYLYGISQRFPSMLGKIMRFLDSFLFGCLLVRHIKKLDFDIIHVTDMPPVVIFKKFIKKPAVYSIRGVISPYYKKLLKNFDGFIAWGSSYDIIKKELDSSKIIHLNPGVDTNLFTRCDTTNLKKKYNLCGKVVLLFVGRFVYLKNLPFLLKAFRRLSNYSNKYVLMLVGDGPLIGNIKKKQKS